MLLFFLLVYILNLKVCAYAIKGKVYNELNEPLSFVNVFVSGTQLGTSTNENGFFELKLEPNSYTIIFQYVGYKQLVHNITITNTDIELNIVLQPQNYQLKELAVNATSEDPAYPIMRQAMVYRKIYLNEAKEFECRAYMKALQRLTSVPKRVMLIKVPEDIKPGIVYLSESVSELSFKQPNKIKETLISSKVSGNNKAFSFNRAGSLNFSLYQAIVPSYGLNERGFISPLAPNAFGYYKFKLEGEQQENNLTIFKIKVIPIREHGPVFSGHIYIVKNSWRLHSTDLLLDKKAQIEFVDNLVIKQSYAPQQNGVWMPVSQRFIFSLDLFGFKGNGYFVALYSNYKTISNYPQPFYGVQAKKIEENEPVPQLKTVKKVKLKAETTEQTLFKPKHFNNEILRVEPKANKTTDIAWDTLRPIALTQEEIEDYHEKDSIEIITESKPYQDSMDRKNNKLDISAILISGYTYQNSFKKLSYSFDPISAMLQYNTIEGFVLNQKVSIEKEFESGKRLEITPQLRYGFASNKFYAALGASYFYNRFKMGKVGFNAGSFVKQINNKETISPFVNSVYTLFNQQNYLKLYHANFIKLQTEYELINGLYTNSSISYAQRSMLSNTTNYAFNHIKDRDFTSNSPVNTLTSNTNFVTNNALVFNLTMRLIFNQKYVTRATYRYRYASKNPIIYLLYNKGIEALNSHVNFDEFNVMLTHQINLKLFGDFDYIVKVGTFLNKSKTYLMDYHHFAGNQTVFAQRGFSGFQLLDYYFYSTNNQFAEAHFTQHFNGLFFNKIPLIRKLKLQEVLNLRYLKTSESPHIIEAGFGIEHIFKIFRIDYCRQYLNGNYNAQGIRVGFGF